MHYSIEIFRTEKKLVFSPIPSSLSLSLSPSVCMCMYVLLWERSKIKFVIIRFLMLHRLFRFHNNDNIIDKNRQKLQIWYEKCDTFVNSPESVGKIMTMKCEEKSVNFTPSHLQAVKWELNSYLHIHTLSEGGRHRERKFSHKKICIFFVVVVEN